MSLSIKDVLAAKPDTPKEVVPVPECGGDVTLVPCSSSSWDEYELRLGLARNDPAEARGVKARLVAACWADDKGNRTPLTDAEIVGLSGMHPKIINRLHAAAERLCEDVGPAEKNSESSPAEPS